MEPLLTMRPLLLENDSTLPLHRFLGLADQAESVVEQQVSHYDDSNALKDTIVIYGSVLLGVILLYSWLRGRFPKVYNVRRWVGELKTSLAEDHYKFLSWMWRVYIITDDEIMEECGMDASCFIRLIQMGYRISVVGVFNMIWLLPVYRSSASSDKATAILDPIVRTTISVVPSGSPRLYATVIAAYVMFGYTMYQILREFEWYVEMRHKFLSKTTPRQFAVFVRNIPSYYKDNNKLASFFRDCFTDSVLEARMVVQVPSLRSAIEKRKITLESLEHSLALYNTTGIRPRHTELFALGGEVDSIDYYSSRLAKLNRKVAEKVAYYEAVMNGQSPPASQFATQDSDISLNYNGAQPESENTPSNQPLIIELENDVENELPSSETPKTDVSSIFSGNTGSPTEEPTKTDLAAIPSKKIGLATSLRSTVHTAASNVAGATTKMAEKAVKASVTTTLAASKAAVDTTMAVSKKAVDTTMAVSKKAVNTATTAAGHATKVAKTIVSGDDGKVHSAGFVVFNKLSSTNAALQMIHHSGPFTMEVLEAPDPREVNWQYVGRTHKDLQVGMLISIVMTTGLCLLWTIPISFFASLSNASAVGKDVKFLGNLFSTYPGLVPLTQQLAPFLVVAFNALLPIFLEFITMFEGPISSGVNEASKFIKLAAFSIIQTFFVSAISGSVVQEISKIIEDWSKIIELLATSLPAQGTYFMQILLISTATSAGWELLRVTPLISGLVRRYVGPNLTEKERNKPYYWFRPLSSPQEFGQSDSASQLVLYFMVLFVYAVISPITPLLTAVCFAFLGAMFRNQFIYIYPNYPDSGGKVWAYFIQIMLSCMLIAQATILGLLGLKKGIKQIPFFLPLMYMTVLFNIYIRQKHFRVASHLPTRDCVKADKMRGPNFDYSFVLGAYTQPELASAKYEAPDPSLMEGEKLRPPSKSEIISLSERPCARG